VTTHRFTEVKVRASKVLPCSRCARSVRRSTTITHTINPFNKNADGTVKTYTEVRADVDREAATWKAEPVVCAGCADA
jgi:uncharacterized metal-binding protein YceD (DUF177 family)